MTDWTRIYAYDTETYPNCYLLGLVHVETERRWIYEISDRYDHSAVLMDMLTRLRTAGCRMLGFNNVHFDYPVLHEFIRLMQSVGHVTAADLYAKAQAIFAAQRNDFSHTVWESDHFVPQIDIFKIMHFDNVARSTSLKKLEMAMRSYSVVDLPYAPGTHLTPEQIDVTTAYMCHDVAETIKFARQIDDQIRFRDELTARYDRDFTNFNDTKIGKQYFIDQMEKAGIACYDRSTGRRQPRQTPRSEGIHVGRRLIPIPFETDDLRRMWSFFNAAVIPADQTKGFFTDLTADLRGFTLWFGAGGIHGSVEKTAFLASDTHSVEDVDVESYYPSLAIVNRWYPEHLGEAFCDIYADLKTQRVSYPKGTAENSMLKLSLNGVYGDSNNKHSVFLDPAYTMAITINGQLLLAWLAELVVLHVPGAVLIQVNTDGLTCYLPRDSLPVLDQVKAHWSAQTRLKLEQVAYAKMLVRDVNNYIAIDTKGKVKRKNAYLIAPEWHQDHSSLVIPKAVDAFVQHGTPVHEFINGHADPFDFMRHVKVPRSSTLWWGDVQIQNTSRYFISLSGAPMTKLMPPLSGRTDPRSIAVDKGWLTRPCNVVTDFAWHDLNRRFYITEAEKLVAGLGLSC